MRLPKLLLFVTAVSTGAFLSAARLAEEEGTDRELLVSKVRSPLDSSNFGIALVSSNAAQ